MKKIITLLLSFLLLFSCFSTFAMAEEQNDVLTFSDDIKTIYVSGESYTRFNSEDLRLYDFTDSYLNVLLSDNQKELIKTVDVSSNEEKTILFANFSYRDGARMESYYLKDSCREIYENLIENNHDTYKIDFNYDYNNDISVKAKDLRGKMTVLKAEDYQYEGYTFDVLVGDPNSGLFVAKGNLAVLYDKFYFIDYSQLSREEIDNMYNYVYVEDIPAWEITDEKLLETLKHETDEYYNDSWGIYYADDVTEVISLIFIFLVFGVVPLAAVVLFIIFAKRSKRPIYKKLCYAIVIASAMVLVIFITLATIYFLN